MEQVQQNRNILWVDVAKFITIFLVVLGHLLASYNLFSSITNYIYLFHIPVFFILSGYLYKHIPINNEIKKISSRLLFPYIIYQLLYLPFQLISNSVNYKVPFSENILKCFTGILIGDAYNTPFSHVVCYSLWFLYSLMFIRIIFASFRKLNKTNILLLLIIPVVILKVLILNGIDLICCFDNTLMAIPYFTIGYCLQNYQNIFGEMNNTVFNFIRTYKYIFIIICPIILLYLLHINGVIHLNLYITNNLRYKSLILSYLGGIVGFIWVYLIAGLLNKENYFIKTISKHTLFILLFHTICIFISKAIGLNTIIESDFIGFLFLIAISLTILGISFFIIQILEKHACVSIIVNPILRGGQL